MILAVAYLRVSGKGQIDGDGFDRQEEAIRRCAEHLGYDITGVHREEGVSGTKSELFRPAYMRMLEVMRVSKFDTILVENMDRFARDLIVQELLLGELKKEGFHLIPSDIQQDMSIFDNDDPMRVLIRQILGAIAQYAKSIGVLRMRHGRERVKREKGKCEGQKGYAARDPETVKFILAHYQEWGPIFVAASLNAQNKQTLMGMHWTHKNVEAVWRRHHGHS